MPCRRYFRFFLLFQFNLEAVASMFFTKATLENTALVKNEAGVSNYGFNLKMKTQFLTATLLQKYNRDF